jgi:hypothetical protein
MANQTQQPVSARATAATDFDGVRREIAQRNEEAQKKARKLRDERDQARIRARRQGTSL